MSARDSVAPDSGLRTWSLMVSIGALLAIGLSVAAQWDVQWIFDDAFMYVRYADHWIASGVVQWNPGGPATFGTTSLAHLALVTLVRRMGVAEHARVLLSVTTIVGALWILALWRLVMTVVPAQRTLRLVMPTVVFLALLSRASILAGHFTSGMDTVTAMLALTLYLVAVTRVERARSVGALIVAAALGPLLMVVRPDLLVFSLGIPAAWWLWPSVDGDRRRATLALVYMAACTAVTLWAQGHWLGSILPLPFWAKTTNVYGAEFMAIYRLVSAQTLFDFLLKGGLPVAAIAVVAIAGPRVVWRSAGPVLRGAMIGAAVFMAFYGVAVTPIMDFGARFYQPLLPVFAMVLVQAAVVASTELQLDAWQVPVSVRRHIARSAGVLSAGIVLMLIGQQAVALGGNLSHGVVFRTSLREGVAANAPCWQQVEDVPTPVVFASTEVGALSSNSNRVVHDLAGLNSPEFLRTPLDVHRIVALQPDALLGLHGDYREQLRAIRADPEFQRMYMEVGDASVQNPGLNAIRRDSPYAALLLSTGPCR